MVGVSKAPQESRKSGSGRWEMSRSQAGDWESLGKLGPASGNLVAFPRKSPSTLEDRNISLAWGPWRNPPLQGAPVNALGLEGHPRSLFGLSEREVLEVLNRLEAGAFLPPAWRRKQETGCGKQ